jgi:hypothetical protein
MTAWLASQPLAALSVLKFTRKSVRQTFWIGATLVFAHVLRSLYEIDIFRVCSVLYAPGFLGES